MKPVITIDKEFRDLLPKPTDAELAQLESSLVHEGCREALVVWKTNAQYRGHCKECRKTTDWNPGDGNTVCDVCGYGVAPEQETESHILLDGHNRYTLCQKHGLVFKTREIESADRQTASLWIIANQLGRRNLHPNHYAYYEGKRYEVEKSSRGGDRKSKGQNAPLKGGTAKAIAAETGEDEKTVKRNAEFSRGVDVMEAAIPGSKAEILNGKHTLTKGEIQKVAKIAKAEPKKLQATLAKAKEQPGEMEKLLRDGEKKPYPWSDVDCLVEVMEAIEKLHAMPWDRIKEYVTKSPTGICLLRDSNFKRSAIRFAVLAKKLHKLK